MRLPRRIATLALGVAFAGLFATCGLIPGLGGPPGRPVGVEVSNGTTLPITIVVNGAIVANIAPGQGTPGPMTAEVLGPLPWNVAAKTPSGRVLLTLTVNDGDVFYGQNTTRGDGARVDLSCGRLDIWAGPPMIGPMPGPGSPGDCVP